MDLLRRQLTSTKSRFSNQPLAGTALLGSISVLLAWACNDYRQFKALGRGGVPYNIFGWLIVTIILRPLSLRKQDVIWTGDYEDQDSPASPEILNLPARKGEGAIAAGIVPQRQMTQNAEEGMRKPLQNLFLKDIVRQNPDVLETKLSHYERHNPALYVKSSLLSSRDTKLPEQATVAQGEIGHVHPDLSFHLYFSQADAKVVMEKGWGERHRLARRPPWYVPGTKRFPLGIAETYVLIYGPRDDEEFEVVKVLLRASAKYMTGHQEIKLD